MKKGFKLGLLGLGKVGLNVLVENAKRMRFNIYWIADSKNFLAKTDSSPFSGKEQMMIARSKQKSMGSKLEKIRNIPKLSVANIKDPRDEASLIREKTENDPKQWAILDATSTRLKDEFEIVKSALGCLAYCTCNKTVWADYEKCSTLFDEAIRKSTILALNCTTGVWVDQMDILPVIFNAYRSGDLQVTKRDNSSFNLFFAKVENDGTAVGAMNDLQKAGHLEPGAGGLLSEVKDQFIKARISANIIGKLIRIRPSCVDGTDLGLGEVGRPKSKREVDIASWHNDERKSRNKPYPALVTRMRMDGRHLECKTDFELLPKANPLAKNFPGKNVILVEAMGNTRFEWVSNQKAKPKSAGKSYFLHSGYGGAYPTATKLLKEVERALSIATNTTSETIFPIPILCALNSRLPYAVRFENSIANHFR